jgi:dihydroflavonol-4-reductase
LSYLITGATGFLGGHVLSAIAAHPQTQTEPLWLLVRNKATWDACPHAQDYPHIRLIEAELTDEAAIGRALGQVQLKGVFHLAAQVHHSRSHSAEQKKTNVAGTQAIIRICLAHHARLIFLSTSGTVGCSRRAQDRPDENAPYCAHRVRHWPYYASKIEAELAVQTAMSQHNLQAVTLRPPVMLGPGDHRFRATSLIIRFLRRKLPFYLAGGMHFIDVRDAAAATVAAMVLPKPRAVYHLCGAEMSLQAYFAQLSHVSGIAAPTRRLAHGVAWCMASLARGRLVDPVVVEMGRHYWGLSSRYAHELQYTSRDPQITLRETVAYLRAHHPKLAKVHVSAT